MSCSSTLVDYASYAQGHLQQHVLLPGVFVEACMHIMRDVELQEI